MLSSLLACIFGYMMLALSIVVTVETIGRKLFDFSLQGADELGGYALAVGSSIGFSAALIERAHIRVDLFHGLLPRPLRILLNRSEEHTSELQSLMRISYAVFCLKKKKQSI